MCLKLLIVPIILILAGCNETILHDLSEQDANRVVVALSRSGVEAQRVREGNGWSIAVCAKEIAAALTAIEETQVLAREGEQTERGSALGATAGLFLSREERQAALSQAAAKQLEDTLERFPGVAEARVHLFATQFTAVQFRRGIGEGSSGGSSASVLLVTNNRELVSEQEIKQLIAGATATPVESVSVLITLREPIGDLARGEVVPQSVGSMKSLAANRYVVLLCCACVPSAGLICLRLIERRRRRETLQGLRKAPAAGAAQQDHYRAELRAAQQAFEANSAWSNPSGQGCASADPSAVGAYMRQPLV